MTSLPAVLVLAAGSVLLWPVPAHRIRLRRPPSKLLDRSRVLALSVLAALLLIVMGAPWWVAAALIAIGAWASRRAARAHHRWSGLRSAAAQLDVLALCLEAGSSPAAALRDASAIPNDAPRISLALQQTSALLAIGAAAQDAWQPVEQCLPIADLAVSARSSSLTGATLADAARSLAARLRADCRTAAGATSSRAGVAVAAPLTLCFLPAFVCLGLAPIIVGLVGTLPW